MQPKIAVVSSSAPPVLRGGISAAHYDLYRALRRSGVDARLYTFRSLPVRENVDEQIVHCTQSVVGGLLVDFVFGVHARLTGRPSFALETQCILRSALGAMRANRSIRRFGPDAIIVPDHGAPGLFISRPRNGRMLLVSHHNPRRFVDMPFSPRTSVSDTERAIRFENRVLKKIDHVICPSVYMARCFKDTYACSAPVSVVPNIVEHEKLDAISSRDLRLELGLPSAAPVIYIPSGGNWAKGARFVPEIIRRLAAVHCQPVGFYISGVISAELALDLAHVPEHVQIHMPGRLSHAENISTMKGCCFCVSPTLVESFGMALLEACVAGLPVVAFDTGGVADIVENEKNGFLAPHLDVDKLVHFAGLLLDERVRARIAMQTADFSRRRIDPGQTVSRILDLAVPQQWNA